MSTKHDDKCFKLIENRSFIHSIGDNKYSAIDITLYNMNCLFGPNEQKGYCFSY